MQPALRIILTLAITACGVAPAQAKSAKAPVLLTSANLDPKLILPPPPAANSPQALAELAELHAIETARTPAAEADARRDGDTKNGTIFAEVLGPRFDLDRLPATAALLALVRASEKDAADRGKDEFRRQRPYILDPSLRSCKRNDDPLSSYPSGHTSMAFAMAEVLARLVPSKAPELLARAARYGQSRIVCGQHFRSDVSAGQMLGLAVAERLSMQPAFHRAFAAAARELATVALVPNH